MKRTAVNIMVTTGTSILILALIAAIIGGTSLNLSAIYQTFLANIVIHICLFFTHKFESKYIVLEFLLDTSSTIAVLVVFGAIFGWFNFTPIWVLAVMTIVIYTFGLITNIFRLREDAKEINKLMQKRREKNTGTASG